MLLSKEQLAEILQVSVSTINKQMAKGMPHVKVGKVVRFEQETVMNWLRNRK